MTTGNVAAWQVDLDDSNFIIREIKLGRKYNSLDSISEAYSAGVYTTFRTYRHDYALLLDNHFDRLEESAKLINGKILVPRDLLRLALRKILENFHPNKDLRIRIALNLNKQTYLISAEPLRLLPASAYRKGVSVVTYPLERENPHAKITDFITVANRLRRTLSSKIIHEIVMVDTNGYLLEGLSSNFWGVVDGIVRTEKDRVLNGITRSIIIELCRKEKIPLSFNSIHVKELQNLTEAFITSSSRAILPVTFIDYQRVGTGIPGSITKLLAERYQEFVNREIKKI